MQEEWLRPLRPFRFRGFSHKLIGDKFQINERYGLLSLGVNQNQKIDKIQWRRAEIQNLKRLKEYRGQIFPYPVKGQGAQRRKTSRKVKGSIVKKSSSLFKWVATLSFEIVRARSGKANRRQSLCRQERGRLEQQTKWNRTHQGRSEIGKIVGRLDQLYRSNIFVSSKQRISLYKRKADGRV